MANHEHVKLLKQGSIIWNKWKKQHPKALPNLSGANLSGANLSSIDLSSANLIGADLRNTDLSEANLHKANLWGANLNRANLSRANLGGADLIEAELNDANLVGANLSDADLGYASLSRADLNGVNFSRAITWMTTFADVDLSTAIGLTTVVQKGPSTIGIDTIYRSQGMIPERFLREAGVPDTLLDIVHSLTSKTVPYFTCFISHSRKDQRFCDRLYSDLQAKGVKAWYFPADAIWGNPVWGEIDSSIKRYDKLVVVCSKYSLQSSPVNREIERALQREDREKKHILFPLRLDNYLFDKWEHERKADVLSKVVGDFRSWSRDAKKYEAAFQKFLKALKAPD